MLKLKSFIYILCFLQLGVSAAYAATRETRSGYTQNMRVLSVGDCFNSSPFSDKVTEYRFAYTVCREIRHVQVEIQGPKLSWNKKTTELPGTENYTWELGTLEKIVSLGRPGTAAQEPIPGSESDVALNCEDIRMGYEALIVPIESTDCQ